MTVFDHQRRMGGPADEICASTLRRDQACRDVAEMPHCRYDSFDHQRMMGGPAHRSGARILIMGQACLDVAEMPCSEFPVFATQSVSMSAHDMYDLALRAAAQACSESTRVRWESHDQAMRR